MKKRIHPKTFIKRASEQSFTLFETLIALLIMSVLMIELMSVQTNSVYYTEYGSNITRGIFLAKRVMSQVEYYWQTKPFKEIKYESRDENRFEDFPEFTYKLSITDWKLPILDLLTGGGLGGDDQGKQKKPSKESESAAGGGADVLNQVFGDEPILRVAQVEVLWPEGAKKNSVTLTYLLTNQKKVDEQLVQLKPAYEDLVKASRTNDGAKPSASPTATPTGSPVPQPPPNTPASGK